MRTDGWLLIATALACGTAGCAARTGAAEASAPRVPSSDAVAELCAGLPDVEQERPYFLREGGIESVHPVTAERSTIKFKAPGLLGAEIVLRPAPAVTKHWVARVLRCHMADPVNLALNQRFDDPLVVGLPTVSLDQTSDRIVLRIVGRDEALGEEILRRARELSNGRVGESVASEDSPND